MESELLFSPGELVMIRDALDVLSPDNEAAELQRQALRAYVDGAILVAEADEPCPVNRRPKGTCPDGCTHGEG